MNVIIELRNKNKNILTLMWSQNCCFHGMIFSHCYAIMEITCCKKCCNITLFYILSCLKRTEDVWLGTGRTSLSRSRKTSKGFGTNQKKMTSPSSFQVLWSVREAEIRWNSQNHISHNALITCYLLLFQLGLWGKTQRTFNSNFQ